MQDGRVGFGLLGAGLVAPFHARALQASSNARLVAIADTTRIGGTSWRGVSMRQLPLRRGHAGEPGGRGRQRPGPRIISTMTR